MSPILPQEFVEGGHMVKSVIALDPETRRIFFMDGDNNPLYAEYASADQGFSIQKVGYQREISKEYDPVDLEADDSEELTITDHEEREVDNTPGLIPAGTPGEKPQVAGEDNEYWGEGLGDEGYDPEPRHAGRRDSVRKTMATLDKLLR